MRGDWFIADVLALKRDIPLVQRFNHLIVKYVSASPFEKGERKQEVRENGDEHEGLIGLCIDYSFSLTVNKHTKLSSTKSKDAIIIKIYIIIYDFGFFPPRSRDTFNIFSRPSPTHTHEAVKYLRSSDTNQAMNQVAIGGGELSNNYKRKITILRDI